MGRPFRRQFERRQIARPSYGGEREPDSHPTPGPPAFVQPARVLLPSSEGRAPRSSPGVVRSPGRSALSSRRPVGTDDSPGAWIAAALRRDRTVASLVPPVFEAYARVLHPAVRYAGDDDVDVRWDEVAAYNGTTAHRLMQWPAITGSWEQSAAAWWPADRAWFVATDPALMSTYVGGPAGAVDALLGSLLEAHPAVPDDPVGYDTDPVNPP